VNNQVLRKAV